MVSSEIIIDAESYSTWIINEMPVIMTSSELWTQLYWKVNN